MNKKYTDKEKEEYLKYLKELIFKVNYKNQLNSKRNAKLREFIENSVPELSNSFFTIQTKIFWLLNDIHDFPKCQNKHCNHVFNDVNVNPKYGYKKYCSYKCANSCKEKQELTDRNIIKKYGSLENFQKIKGKKYSAIYNRKTKEEKEAIKEKRRQTNRKHFGVDCNFSDPSNKEKSKKTCILKYGVENPSQSKMIQDKIETTKLERHGDRFYTNREQAKKTCLKKFGVEYAIQAKEVREKGKQTNLRKFGVENGGASDLAHKKMAKKYFYDNTIFTSSAELAYYIWLKDNNIKFEYQPKYLEYYDEWHVKHRYYPDFKVEEQLIELKGDHLIDENGKLLFPFKKNLSKKEIDRSQRLFNAKQKCMEDNNVTIIKYSDCKVYYDYIDNKYGKKYLETFRKNNK